MSRQKLVIVTQGGIIQEVITDGPELDVTIIDYDAREDASTFDEVTLIEQGEGKKPDLAYANQAACYVTENAERFEHLHGARDRTEQLTDEMLDKT